MRADKCDRPGDVRDRRRGVAVVGAGRTDHHRDSARVSIHQARSPAPRAPRPAGRSRRAGGSRGMGADQPVALTEEDLLRLLKQAASDLGVKAWVVGGYVRDKLVGTPQPNPPGAHFRAGSSSSSRRALSRMPPIRGNLTFAPPPWKRTSGGATSRSTPS